MNKAIYFLIILTIIPAVTFAAGAAPYTDEALQKINRAIKETPKEVPAQVESREEYHKHNVEYFTEVFAKAGYSFTETIDKIVDDMQNSPEAIPADRDTVYDKLFTLLHILMYECDYDKVDCLKFYPAKTRQAILWFRKNSGFSPEDHGTGK
jgi:hypothetical protein